MKEARRPFVVYITAEFEYPCEAGDKVEAEMMARHVAGGELGNTPLLGAGSWHFNAEPLRGGDEWAV